VSNTAGHICPKKHNKNNQGYLSGCKKKPDNITLASDQNCNHASMEAELNHNMSHLYLKNRSSDALLVIAHSIPTIHC